MIKKEDFCDLLKCCRDFTTYTRQLYSLGISLRDNSPADTLIQCVIDSLDNEFDGDTVSYYFFERDCNGTEMYGESVPLLWEKDGTPIWIHSDEELYDYLVSIKKED